MSARISRYESRHAPGADVAPHRHVFAYAALVLEGSYEEAGPDGLWMCEEGDLIVHPPFHLHINRFPRKSVRVVNFTLPHSEVRRLGVSAYGVFRQHDADGLRRARDHAGAIAEALRCAKVLAPAPHDWLVEAAFSLLRDNADVAGVAREAGVTSEHFSRAFKRRFGLGPAAFRAEQRVRRALQLLTERRALSEIAFAAGFADQPHFTRALRGATGLTPTALRTALA